MGELVHVLALHVGVDNPLDVLVLQRVLVLARLELLARVDEEHVAAVAVALCLQHQQAHRNGRAVEQVRGEADNRIEAVQVPHDVLADDLLGTAAEQHAVGQQHRDASVIVVHVINHVLHECIVGVRLRRQLARARIPRVVQQRRVRVVLQRVGRVAHLHGHLHVAVLVLAQRVALVDVEVLIINAVHQHVHAGEVVRGGVVLLPVEVTDAPGREVLLHLQKHGRRAAGAVSYCLRLIQTDGRQRCYQLRRSRGCEELAALLARVRCEQADENHVRRAQHVELRIRQAEVNLADFHDDLRDERCPLGNGIAQIRVLQLHVIEQPAERSLGRLPHGGTCQLVHRALVVLDAESVRIVLRADNFAHKLPEQILGLDDVTQVLDGPLLDNRAVVRIGERLLVGQPVLLQNLLHVLLGALRQVAVENRPEDVISELRGIHVPAQVVRDGPELLGKLARLRLIFHRINHVLLSFCLVAAICVHDELLDGARHLRNLQKPHVIRGQPPADCLLGNAPAEGVLREDLQHVLRIKPVVISEGLNLGLQALALELLVCLLDVRVLRQLVEARADERLHDVLLRTERIVVRALNLAHHQVDVPRALLIGLLGVVRRLQQAQDVHHVDAVGSHQLHVKIDVDGHGNLRVPFLRLIVIVEVPALVALVLLLVQHDGQIGPVELAEGLEGRQGAGQRAERHDELADVALALELPRIIDGLRRLAQHRHLVHPLVHVILVALQQVLVRVPVAGEQPQRIVLRPLDVAVRHNLPELLRHLVHTVRSAVRLHQRVPDEVLVQIQRVQRLGVEPGEHHVDHQQDVHLRKVLLLHAPRDVLAVRIEGVQREGRAEHRVVVVHAAPQKLLGVLVAALVHVLVGLVREDCGHAVALALRPRLVQCLERVVILPERLDGIDREQRRVDVLSLRVDMLLVMLEDVLRDDADALVVMIQGVQIEVVAATVIRVAQTLRVDAVRGDLLRENRPLVLDGEPQDVAVRDSVLNHVAVQAGIQLRAGIEHVGGRPAVLALVRLENRRTRESDVVRVAEMPLDVAVHLAELAAVALVDDEHDLLVAVRIHQRLVALALDRVRHLLDGRHDELAVRLLQLPHQHGGRIRPVNTVLLERVVLVHGLVVEVLSVNQEDDLVDPRLIAQKLRQLEGRERLARTSACEDVPVLVRLQHAPLRRLHGENLIRPHDHQHRLGGLDDHVFIQHLGDGRAPQELGSELVQLVDALVVLVRPEEHQALQNRVVHAAVHLVLVAKVLCLH